MVQSAKTSAESFSPALLVPVAPTGTNDLFSPVYIIQNFAETRIQ
jgi:hypothetical protein